MNPLLHFLISYIFVDAIFKNAKEYFLIIFISSTFLDLDHLIYIFKKRKKIFKERFGAKSRSILHEFLGMFILFFFASILYFILDEIFVKLFCLCLLFHYALDFLIGESRPFYPYHKKEIKIIELSRDSRLILEMLLTIIFLLVFAFQFY